MLATLGDLVEDVVVRVADPVNVATDTAARIERRRGGSAANVAAAAARLGHAVRFLGQVGDGPVGDALVSELGADGVDVSHVRRGGRVATIAVLVDPSGERTMLSDRGACADLSDPDPRWLDGVTTLHVPFYSLAADPLATAARTLIEWCHQRGAAVSVDVSSVAVIEALGVDRVLDLLGRSRPAVVFANRDEARVLGVDGPLAGAVTVIKQGPDPAIVYAGDERHEIPVAQIEVDDTTGAGDAFAAGFLGADWQADPVDACRSGHRAARAAVTQR